MFEPTSEESIYEVEMQEHLTKERQYRKHVRRTIGVVVVLCLVSFGLGLFDAQQHPLLSMLSNLSTGLIIGAGLLGFFSYIEACAHEHQAEEARIMRDTAH